MVNMNLKKKSFKFFRKSVAMKSFGEAVSNVKVR